MTSTLDENQNTKPEKSGTRVMDPKYRVAIRRIIELVDEYRKGPRMGDPDLRQEIGESFGPLMPFVKKRVRAKVWNREDAEEIEATVQFQFLKACTDLEGFKLEEDKVLGWLKKVIRFRYADFCRALSRVPKTQGGVWDHDDLLAHISREVSPLMTPEGAYLRGYEENEINMMLQPLLDKIYAEEENAWQAQVIVLAFADFRETKDILTIMNTDPAHNGRVFEGSEITTARKRGRRFLVKLVERPTSRQPTTPSKAVQTEQGEPVEPEGGSQPGPSDRDEGKQ